MPSSRRQSHNLDELLNFHNIIHFGSLPRRSNPYFSNLFLDFMKRGGIRVERDAELGSWVVCSDTKRSQQTVSADTLGSPAYTLCTALQREQSWGTQCAGVVQYVAHPFRELGQHALSGRPVVPEGVAEGVETVDRQKQAVNHERAADSGQLVVWQWAESDGQAVGLLDRVGDEARHVEQHAIHAPLGLDELAVAQAGLVSFRRLKKVGRLHANTLTALAAHLPAIAGGDRKNATALAVEVSARLQACSRVH
ncbi:hypothetical protein T492DRAFT_844906 [Pavlovales sp. CCMP2436]|nr:hypothetical protein T492DRAFT_844906 [Pavlovales sp. CCMP2436]